MTTISFQGDDGQWVNLGEVVNIEVPAVLGELPDEFKAGLVEGEVTIEGTWEWWMLQMPGTVPPIWVPSKLWPYYQRSEN